MKDFEIVSKRALSQNVNEYRIFAPLVAKHCKAGQFVILRVDDKGERVPFTICDYLGNATDLSKYKNICLVGGGIGCAVIYPQAKQLFANGVNVDVIIGARNKDLLMYLDEFAHNCNNLYAITDDGSNGKKGFVTDVLNSLLKDGKDYDCVFAVGPLKMMKAVCNLTKEHGIDTVVSMNSMMVDGTGMCGCCRVSVGGEVKYACVDGPEFDGHAIDFDEAICRSNQYVEQEREHYCNLRGKYEGRK